MRRGGDSLFLLRVKDADVCVGADGNRALAREEAEHFGGGGRGQLDEAVERDAPLDHAAVVDERHAVLDAGRAVIENGEHKGRAGDGQFVKRGECVKI